MTQNFYDLKFAKVNMTKIKNNSASISSPSRYLRLRDRWREGTVSQ